MNIAIAIAMRSNQSPETLTLLCPLYYGSQKGISESLWPQSAALKRGESLNMLREKSI